MLMGTNNENMTFECLAAIWRSASANDLERVNGKNANVV